MRYQKLIVVLLAGAALSAVSAPAAAQPSRDGFYGGIALREGAVETTGVLFGRMALAAPAPQVEDTSAQQRIFGGYRWRNDLALEAGVARSESYALKPFGAGAPGGVGLTLAAPGEAAARAAWNLDVVGSYTFLRAFALYGRVGYAQSELAQATPANLLAGDARRTRDGMNYGLGMRYDVTSALGVNLEYTRFGRFAFESFGSNLPENDQVRLGVQFRF